MKKTLLIVALAASTGVLGGCATRDTGPGAEQTPALSLHPATGYAYPLEQPNAEEQAGVLLRFTFTKALHYREEILDDSSLKGRALSKDETRYDVIYMPTENPSAFVVNISGSPSQEQEWDSRGRFLKSTIKGAGFSIQDTGMFPESPVKIGDTWQQHLYSMNIDINFAENDEKRNWKFVGVTTVRAHRCVVLEGIKVSQLNAQNNAATFTGERTARVICYFDYRLGGIVENVEIYEQDTKPSKTKSKLISDVKGRGQDIMKLVE